MGYQETLREGETMDKSFHVSPLNSNKQRGGFLKQTEGLAVAGLVLLQLVPSCLKFSSDGERECLLCHTNMKIIINI